MRRRRSEADLKPRRSRAYRKDLQKRFVPRRTLAIFLGVLAGLLILPLPALAAPVAESQPSGSEQVQLRLTEIESYKRDFGVSTEVAEENLAIQQRGAGIVELLKATQGDAYAGVWFDNQTGEFVLPLLPSADRAEVTELLEDIGLGKSFRIQSARYRWAELEAAQKSVTADLRPVSSKGLVKTSIDPRRNAVVIHEAQDLAGSAAADLASAATEVAVPTEFRSSDVSRFTPEVRTCNTFKPRICSMPLRGGVAMGTVTHLGGGGYTFNNLGLCTTGFKAIGNVFGNRFMLTAGHCVAGGGLDWGSETPASTVYEIGTVEEYNYGASGDWAKIKANGSEWDTSPWPSEVAHYWENQTYPISYEAWSYLGEYVCFSGNKSGTSCGNVKELHEEGLYDEGSGTPLPPLNEVPGVCNEGGDSGGPFFLFGANTALGMLTAGDGTTCATNIAYYTEITAATTNLGVTVGTRLGGSPSASTTGASEVQARQARANGTVTPNQVETFYLFEWGPTTSYGNVAPVPKASAGHGAASVPVSAVLSGLVPATTYHYRLQASSAAGASTGSDAQFATPAVPPVVSTQQANGLASSKATLNGSVNPENSKSEYWFEYGPTTSYGTKTAVVNLAAGLSPVSVNSPLSGLTFGQTLHYRVVAKNVAGTSYGGDQSLTPGWLLQSNPKAPSATLEHLDSISCASQLYCISVGGYQAGGNTLPLAERWNGTAWQILDFKTPEGGYNVNPEDVSCVSTTACIAVGYYQDLTTGKRLTLTESWNGTEWTIKASKNQGTESLNILTGVSCTASNACTAVGYYGPGHPLIERWNGTEWTLQSPAGTSGQFNDVSCSSATDCMAVGYGGFAQRWDGSKWIEAAAVKVGEGSNFEDVSCASPTYCMAVGFALIGGPSQQDTISELWTGSKWETKSTPTFTGISRLFGVSCVSTTACMAVGYPGDSLRPLADRWNGSSWEFQAPPAPSPSPDLISAESVSCSSATVCMFAGYSRFSAMGALTESYHQTPSPTIATKAVTNLKETEASLNGTINPNDTEAKYWFEYGPTTSYGSKTAEASQSGLSTVELGKAISGLSAGTTFHFRIAASNSAGTVYGFDQSFETPINVATRLAAMKVLDPFNGKAVEGSNFATDWSALGWAGGSTPKGQDTATGWGPSDASPTVNGAYFKTVYSDASPGDATVATMAVNPSLTERYFAVWVNAPSPNTGNKNGYEFFLYNTGTNTYSAGLLKFVEGVRTDLTPEKAGISFVNGNSMAIVDRGSSVSAWINTGSGFTQLMSATDSTYSSGKSGVQGVGNITRLTNFKAGSL